ncbi:hypothetical protein ACFFQF_25080 [Haladaptatus pallidirubidus]|uniref:Uncharacterized protein n=1 Tax=Haladaptatus pallidirubidus TaxID=1008152 RepID=A0AAV3UKB5_9EURY|nr:hypothetical protein [Haladaptatus pallidirubidus]
MKKALRLLIALSIVGALFTAGFAGSAAANDYHKDKHDKKVTYQKADATVYQGQDVEQANVNYQEDNYAISAAVGWNDGEAESGDAIAVQYNDQNNDNVQYGEAEAENEHEH